MFASSDIQRLTPAERFQVMEMIWESFADAPEQVPSPNWHGDILAGRLAKVEAGKGNFLTVEQLKQRLDRSRS